MIRPHYKTPSLIALYRSGELRIVVLYLLAGAVTSLTDYALFVLCFNVLNTGLLVATIVAYIGGLIVSFIQSRFLVFSKIAEGQKLTTSFWRYGTILVVNLVLTYLILWVLETWFGLTPLIGKFVVWTFLIFWNFAINKLWVFKGPRKIQKKLFGM